VKEHRVTPQVAPNKKPTKNPQQQDCAAKYLTGGYRSGDGKPIVTGKKIRQLPVIDNRMKILFRKQLADVKISIMDIIFHWCWYVLDFYSMPGVSKRCRSGQFEYRSFDYRRFKWRTLLTLKKRSFHLERNLDFMLSVFVMCVQSHVLFLTEWRSLASIYFTMTQTLIRRHMEQY